MGGTFMSTDLVFDAMRLAEHAHRPRPRSPHHCEAPDGEDRPFCFICLTEIVKEISEGKLFTKKWAPKAQIFASDNTHAENIVEVEREGIGNRNNLANCSLGHVGVQSSGQALCHTADPSFA